MIRTLLRAITDRGEDGRMAPGEVEERMAAARLWDALVAHVEAVEEPPTEVSEAVRRMFEEG